MAGRRAGGEGSYRQRANGTWEASLRYTTTDGERKRLSVYGKTRDEARRKLNTAVERIAAGQPVRDSKQTVGAWVARWREQSLPASNRKASTRELYAIVARKHLEAGALADTPLDRLRPTNVEAFVLRLRESGLSDTSVRNIYGVLKCALDVAVRDGHLATNPAAKVKRPAVAKREAKHLAPADVTALLAQLAGDGSDDQRRGPLRYGLAVRLMAVTGIRRGEAAALRWVDVDLEGSAIVVSGTISRLDGVLVRTSPKTTRSRRTIQIPSGLATALKKHKRAQAAERLRAGDAWEDTGAVFATAAGGWIGPDNLGRTVTIAAKRAGLDGVTAHTLRHSAATAWLEGGVHIRAVADLLGHSSIAVTGDIYTHASSERQQAAVDGLAAALGM